MMKNHWSFKYIGKKWDKEHDCWWWFRKILKDEFGHDLPLICIENKNTLRLAANMLNENTANSLGWVRTGNPKEGDAVFLSQSRICNTHIGVVIFDGPRRMVLHAMDNLGVVASDAMALRTNNLYEKEFWTYAGSV